MRKCGMVGSRYFINAGRSACFNHPQCKHALARVARRRRRRLSDYACKFREFVIHLAAAAATDPKQRSVAREGWYGVLPRKGVEQPTSPQSQGKHFPNMATHRRVG